MDDKSVLFPFVPFKKQSLVIFLSTVFFMTKGLKPGEVKEKINHSLPFFFRVVLIL